jgi:SAM-dependent methyltransferase
MVRAMSTTVPTSTRTYDAATDPADLLRVLDGVVDRLRAGAMVADLGSGDGQSTLAMAQAFPRSAFTGYDADATAVAAARRRVREVAADASGGRNVRFDVADATAIPPYAFDLVTSFGAPHELGDPAQVARHVRRSLADDGTWMIVAPRGTGTAEILGSAGFSRVRIAAATPLSVVLEARP